MRNRTRTVSSAQCRDTPKQSEGKKRKNEKGETHLGEVDVEK